MVSNETVSKLQTLLAELEGQLDGYPDPSLIELRTTVGAALAALYRVTVEQRVSAPRPVAAHTRH